MKKIGKVIGIFAVILVGLVIVLTVLAKMLITPERVKAQVLPLAQQALHREVQLGDVDVSLFSGIVLKNLLIKEKSGDAAFVAADQVVLRYQFWPLLFMRVVVDEVRLEAPKITVIRQADGKFNFSDLAGDPTTASDGSPAPVDAGATEQKSIDLLVSKVAIAGGELQIIDYAINAKAPYRYKMSDLTVQARDISLQQSFPFGMRASLNGSPLAIDGSANLKSRSGQVKLQLTDLDVTAFSPYLRDKIPGKLGSLKVSADLNAEGGAESLTTRGKVDFQDIDVTLNALPDAPFKKASLALDYDVQVDLARTIIMIDKANANFNGITLDLSGQVVDYSKSPKVDLVAVLNELDLRAALAAVPQELVSQVKGLDPAGSVRAKVNLAGSVDKPLSLIKTGEVHLSGIQASAGGMRPTLTGMLSLAGDQVAADKLKLTLDNNTADINFKASHLFAKPIVVSSLVTSERFLLDPLLKAGAASTEKAGASGKAPGRNQAEEIGPFDLPIKADGEVRIGQTVYQGLNIDNFQMRYRLVGNIFTIETMTGKVAGGTFSKTATIDLGKKGLAYNAKLNVTSVQADPIVRVFAPKAAGTIFGGLSLEADFDGKGTLPEALRKSLSGKGALVLADGRLTGSSLVQGLADFIRLDELRDLSFSQAKGSYTMKSGKIQMNSDFAGKDVSMSPTGTIGLDGDLNLSLGARLSPALTAKLDRKGEVAQFFVDQQGWSELPLKVGGTMFKPKFSFDASAVKSKVTEKAQSELQKKLEEKVFDKLDSKVDGDQVKEPAKQILDKAIKGLFGK
ncbi:AsmA family protein [Trichloromonas sp.]|uniref:AsmA family protein n=1 Tax=Trichloromonas sp. TaxID=3069249 RepID=UPI003D819509